MAAAENTKFWKPATGAIVKPPEEWPRVHSVVYYNDGDLWRWLHSDEAMGEYCWERRVVHLNLGADGLVFAFSDQTTAMAFKLRFG